MIQLIKHLEMEKFLKFVSIIMGIFILVVCLKIGYYNIKSKPF